MPDPHAQRYIFIGIPVLFFLAAAFHFLYEWSGSAFIVGLFTPVNESVFEHTKMVVLPAALWWGAYALFHRAAPNTDAWCTGALAAVLTSPLIIPLLFYFYTEALGVESVWADMGVTLLAVTAGQLVGRHVCIHCKGMSAGFAVALIVCVILIFALLTVFPPRIPMFLDSESGTYGIMRRI